MNILEVLHNIDVQLIKFINIHLSNVFLDFFMPVVTNLGTVMAMFVIGVIFILFKTKEKRALGILFFAGATVAHQVVDIIKDLIARPRPYHVIEELNVLHESGGFSCPSGHATRVFLMAYLLSAYFGKNVGIVIYLLAVIICVSRPYIGVHYLSDVTFGAILGLVLGKVLVSISERAEFKKSKI